MCAMQLNFNLEFQHRQKVGTEVNKTKKINTGMDDSKISTHQGSVFTSNDGLQLTALCQT